MAVATTYVPTVFTARDRFSDVVRGMTRNTRTFSAGLNRLDQRMNRVLGLQGMGANIRTGAQFGLGLLVYQAGKDAIEYEKAMASLAAVTGTTFGSMRGEIESLAHESSRSVIDVTRSFENIGSKMSEYLDNPIALKNISRASILMADASRMEVDAASEALTSIMNQFAIGHERASEVVNKLAVGEDVGASTIEESVDMMRQFGASIRMAGGDYKDAIAMVQATSKTMGKLGVGRGFRNIMIDMITGEGMDSNKKKALARVGADIKILSGKTVPFMRKLQELRKLLPDNQAMGMYFKKTNMEAGSIFLREFQGTFLEYQKKIYELNTATEKANKNNDTFAKGFKDLKASFTNFIVTTDNANESLQMLKGTMGWMKDNMGSLINGIVYAGIAFAGFKLLVMGARLASFAMSVTMGLTAARAGAMAIAMQGNAVAIGAFNLAMTGYALPLLAGAAAIGVLGYAVYRFSKRHETEADRQVANITKVNGALRGSTEVQKAELEKQLAQKTYFFKMQEAVGKKTLSKQQIMMNDILSGKNGYLKNQNNQAVQRYFQEKLSPTKGYLADLSFSNGQFGSMARENYHKSELEKLNIPEATKAYQVGMPFDEIEKVFKKLTTVSEKKHELEIVIKNLEGVVLGNTTVPYIEGNTFFERMDALYQAPKTSKTTQGTKRPTNIWGQPL